MWPWIQYIRRWYGKSANRQIDTKEPAVVVILLLDFLNLRSDWIINLYVKSFILTDGLHVVGKGVRKSRIRKVSCWKAQYEIGKLDSSQWNFQLNSVQLRSSPIQLQRKISNLDFSNIQPSNLLMFTTTLFNYSFIFKPYLILRNGQIFRIFFSIKATKFLKKIFQIYADFIKITTWNI